MTGEPRSPWDRRDRESALAYSWFRRFRDLGPLRRPDQLASAEMPLKSLRQWQQKHDWRDRAAAWDDEVHRREDAVRLDAIRAMHSRHSQAGRAAMFKGLEALARYAPEDIPPYAAARLLELGARLERDTLTVSVETLQGVPPAPAEDPWEAIARELDAVPDS